MTDGLNLVNFLCDSAMILLTVATFWFYPITTLVMYIIRLTVLITASYSLISRFIHDIKYCNTTVSVVLGLAYGDEGKGKITKALTESKKFSIYSTLKDWIQTKKRRVCIRFGGANNAGHTVYYKGQKIVTHSVPTGIVNGDIAIIGKGCFVNPNALRLEMEKLRSYGIDGKIYVDKNAHIITQSHIDEDIASELMIEDSGVEFSSGANGSTKKGIRFCAADKALRIGKRVYTADYLFENVPGFEMIDTQKFLMELDNNYHWFGLDIIMEGAQGYKLDPDTGDYPYCTSTGCNLSQVLTTGILPQWLDMDEGIWGALKIITSYVGSRKYMRYNCPDLEAYQKFPTCPERGATTDRWRQIDYPDLDDWISAINENGVNQLVINKCDVLNAIYYGKYPEGPNDNNPDYYFDRKPHPDIITIIVPIKIAFDAEREYVFGYRDLPKKSDTYDDGSNHEKVAICFYDNDVYYQFIEDILRRHCKTLKNVYFSYSPEHI